MIQYCSDLILMIYVGYTWSFHRKIYLICMVSYPREILNLDFMKYQIKKDLVLMN